MYLHQNKHVTLLNDYYGCTLIYNYTCIRILLAIKEKMIKCDKFVRFKLFMDYKK